MNLKYSVVKRVIEKNLNDKLQRAQATWGFLNKQMLEAYQRVQKTRWRNENTTEGTRWKKLDPKYEEYKRKKWVNAPGGGRKKLIASGDLFKSVIGPNEADGFKKIISPRYFIVTTSIDYAKWVDEQRTFTTWSPKTIGKLRKMWFDFVTKNELGVKV